MTDRQAIKNDDAHRRAYAKGAIKEKIPGKRWYADNTREPIRDETLRDGLMQVGAVVGRDDLATTSGSPRYALKAGFAHLFDPGLSGTALEKAILDFQNKHLSKSALARLTIVRAGATARSSGVRVTFPNGDTRQIAPGPSSFITRSVVEVFAPKFLENPAVLWLSESGNKVVLRDDSIANALNLKIEVDRNLPDLIFADLGPADPLLIFVEVVATDGAMTARRREALFKLTDAAGFDRRSVVFLTAYSDRESTGFRKTVSQLAWGSFAWFASEPDQIVILRSGGTSGSRLSDLI
jgi:hypothetical protein